MVVDAAILLLCNQLCKLNPTNNPDFVYIVNICFQRRTLLYLRMSETDCSGWIMAIQRLFLRSNCHYRGLVYWPERADKKARIIAIQAFLQQFQSKALSAFALNYLFIDRACKQLDGDEF